jgi:arginine decarboxylase
MGTTAKPEAPRVDQFFMVAEARFDRWRTLLQAARNWERSSNQQPPNRADQQAAVANCFQELRQWEDYFAYPGHALLKSLDERIASGDAAGTARLVQSMSAALLTHSYRTNAGDWEGGRAGRHVWETKRPVQRKKPRCIAHFEVLVVSPCADGLAGADRTSEGVGPGHSFMSPYLLAPMRTPSWRPF